MLLYIAIFGCECLPQVPRQVQSINNRSSDAAAGAWFRGSHRGPLGLLPAQLSAGRQTALQPALQLLGRQRPTDAVALRAIAPEFTQQCIVLRSLHPLGDDLESQ